MTIREEILERIGLSGGVMSVRLLAGSFHRKGLGDEYWEAIDRLIADGLIYHDEKRLGFEVGAYVLRNRNILDRFVDWVCSKLH